MRLQVVDLQGKKSGTVMVDDAVWRAEMNPALVAQVVRVYQSNLRQGEGKTKDRSQVNRTGRKMWKQKGTGRARHGDRTAPQFVGGAKAHGPTGEENYKLRLNRKMKQGALYSVLSDAARENRVTVVDGVLKFTKTKELVKTVERLNGQTVKKGKKILIITEKLPPESIRAARNLEGVTLARPEELNAATVLKYQKIILTKGAVKLIGERIK